MKRFLLALAPVALVGLAGTALARVEADPSRDYLVTPADGSWMICMAVFRGETALKQAHDLVLEIRSRYDLPAFAYDRNADERRKQQEEIDKQRLQLRHYLEAQGVRPEDVHVPIHTAHIEEECVVLVGSYRDMDSARKALNDIRKLRPADTQSPGQTNTISPAAFVVHNPTVPMEQPSQDSDAKALRNLNSGESYSIYNCHKPWTLAIACYQGAGGFAPKNATPGFLDKLFGNGGKEHMDAAALNAHNLAEALRGKGFEQETYVFHTRYRSVVTVGGFDSKDDPRMRNVHEWLMRRLKTDAKVALPIFDQVVPMQVPQ